MINLRNTLNDAHSVLQQAGVTHALIGGFALAAYGQHRATTHIDLLADGTKKEIIKTELIKKGFTLQHESDEELQFKGIGFLDVLLANQKLLTIPKINLLEVKKYADLFGEWPVIEKLQGAKR